MFWGPGVTSTIDEPRVHLHVHLLTVLVDSGPFHGLSLTVLGLEAISMVVKPQGALTSRSSALADWVDFGPFLGQLLTIGVPK